MNRVIFFERLLIRVAVFLLCCPVGALFASMNQTNIGLRVDCNGNVICEPELGENRANCVADCKTCDNNSICEFEMGENFDNCPYDCPRSIEIISAPLLGQKSIPSIYNLTAAEIKTDSARFYWQTDIDARCYVLFGGDSEYRRGAIFKDGFSKSHEVVFAELPSASNYHFKIVCSGTSGYLSQTQDNQFMTLALPDTTPPANVINFEALASDGKIALRWNNPMEDDFEGVMILRGERTYPVDIWSGRLVYRGKEISFVDSGLSNEKKYYYTAFTYDASGNYSSGALASAIPKTIEQITESLPPEIELLPPEDVLPEVLALSLKDFVFIQDGKEIIPDGRVVFVRPFLPFKVLLVSKSLLESTGAITISFLNNEVNYSFLMRANVAKTGYEATITLSGHGQYELRVLIFDHKNRVVKEINGILEVLDDMPLTETSTDERYAGKWVFISATFWAIIFIGYIIYRVINRFWLKK